MAQLQLVRVHELDAVREILHQAATLAQEPDVMDELRSHIFDKAVDLLAARIPIAQQPAMFAPPDLGMRRR